MKEESTVQQQAGAPPEKPADNNKKPYVVDYPTLGRIGLFRSPIGEVYATVNIGDRHETIPVESRRFMDVLASRSSPSFLPIWNWRLNMAMVASGFSTGVWVEIRN